jgi:general secretion pathway protein G
MVASTRSSVAGKTARLTRSGFTLMEVLVVVAIIVVLASVGTMYLLPRLGEAKDNVAKVKLSELSKACETFYLNNDTWPQTLQQLAQQQPKGGKPLFALADLKDPWDNDFEYNPQGPRNGGTKPDIWVRSSPESGKEIGNWPKGQ